MKKFKKMGEISWVIAVIFVAFGTCLCNKADLGISMIGAPSFIIYDAVAKYWSGFSVGMIEYAFQGIILIIMCVAIQRFNWRYLLAFVAAIAYGYTLDLWLLILGSNPFSSLIMRWASLFIGDLFIATGVAFFFRTYLPLEVPELFVAEFCDRYKLKVGKVKWGYDIACLIISVTLAFSLFGDAKQFDWKTIYYASFHHIGLGTVVNTIINAPLIAFFGKVLDRFFEYDPLIPKLHKFLARNKEEQCQDFKSSATE